MKLKKLTASFGTLEGKSLTLGDGLNIIYAPNEGGKSTWAGFLRAMLYGIDTRDRDKKGHLADKNRYQPWTGGAMEGEISLTWGEREITLRRGARGATPFGNFSAVYTQTGEPVTALTGTECGNILVGVGREVYERSAFIGSGALSVSSTPELEKRISSLISTGDEEISYSQVEGQLREWLRRRKHNQSGLIPRLEDELEDVGQKLQQMTQVNGQIAKYAGEQQLLLERLRTLQDQDKPHKRLRTYARDLRYTEALTQRRESQRQLEALERECARFGSLPPADLLRHWQGELSFLKTLDKEIRHGEQDVFVATEAVAAAKAESIDPRLEGLSGQDVMERANQDRDRYLALSAKISAGRLRPAICAMLTVVLLSLLGGAVAMDYLPQLVPIYPMSAIAFIGVIAIGATVSKQKKQKNECLKLLSPYKISEIEALLPLAEGYRNALQAVEEAESHLRQLRTTYDSRILRRESGSTELLDFVHTFAPEVKDFFGCSAALSRTLHTGEELSVMRAKLEGDCRLVSALAEQGSRETKELIDLTPPQEPPHQIAAHISAAQDELRRVEQSLAECTGQQQAMGDPAALSAYAEQVSESLTRRRQEYDALSMALVSLKEANARLQERFSPKLNERASFYLNQLTGGKYTALTVNRDLEGLATKSGAILPHSALSLSRGTADQLYLAVRLAVCDLCIPVEEPVPLVLDDALTAFDEERMGSALHLLRQLATTRQILLFTCQKREGTYFKGLSDVTQISL